MKKPQSFPARTVAPASLLILLCAMSGTAAAADGRSIPSGVAIEVNAGSTTPRKFTLDPNRVVQFPAPRASREIRIRAASANEQMQINAQMDATRPQAEGADRASTNGDNVIHSEEGDLVSPVLVDEAGGPWALPGGVIVLLKEPMSEDQGRALLKERNLKPVRALTRRQWLVESPAGLGSIRLAEELNATGEFAEVSPNWWTEYQPM